MYLYIYLLFLEERPIKQTDKWTADRWTDRQKQPKSTDYKLQANCNAK